MSTLAFPESDKHFKRADGYQARLLKRALPYCRQTSLAVDVGAHVGLITRQMELKFDRVVSFEPQPDNFRCLKQNATKATLHNLAISDVAGLLSMENPAPKNSGAWECRAYNGDGEIQAARLDWFGLKPDLIKYDVQGHEMRALDGSRETLRQCKPVVIVECWRNGERDNGPRHFMEGLGASLVESVGKDLIFAWKESDSDVAIQGV